MGIEICYICKSEYVAADTQFEGKPVHSWHLSELNRTAAPHAAPAPAPESKGVLLDALDKWNESRKDTTPEAEWDRGLPARTPSGQDGRAPSAEKIEEGKKMRHFINKEKVHALHVEGKTAGEIAAAMGINVASVYAALYAMELKPNAAAVSGRSQRSGLLHKVQRKAAKLEAEVAAMVPSEEPREILAAGPEVAPALLPGQEGAPRPVGVPHESELRVVMFEFKGSAASADKAFAAIQAALAR